VDNLEPHTPTNIALSTSDVRAKLVWDDIPDEDFAYYAIYRGATPDFIPSDAYATSVETEFEDTIDEDNRFYRIGAFDFAGNQSPLSEVLEVSFDVEDELPGDFDANGKIDFSDFFLFADGFGGSDPKYDLNNSGGVDFSDFFLFADYFGEEARRKLIALAQEYIGLPAGPCLEQNYPNPFNNSTTIRYRVSESTTVRLEVFDLTGQRVKTLVSDHRSPGSYEVLWDGTNEQGMSVSTGMYLTKLETGGFTEMRKMMLLK